jgi:hypothetical protein
MIIKRRFRVSLSGVTVATASWATAVTLLGAAQVAAQPAQAGQGISQTASDQIQKLLEEKATRSPAQRKIGSNLLLDPAAPRGRAMHGAVPQLRSGVEVDAAGATVVDINGEVTDQLLARIEEVGGEVISSFPQYQAVRARLPLNRLEEVAELDEVRSIRAAIEPELHQVNVSEGDAAHRAAEARSAFGVDGTGVQIGVLSDSVDALSDLQASGDLPNVTILPGQAGTGNSEGTAMLEIVHDLAPGADLLFASANGGEAQFAQNILDLRAAGADVIVDDVSYFTEPVFQDGIVAQAVELVIADGAQYYSSAGNSGNLNDGTSGVWEGDFVPVANAPFLHDFGGGFWFNPITADTQSFFTLQWSDAFGASGNDYDLFLLDPSLSQVIASSNEVQDGNGFPFEIIDTRQRDDTGNNLVIIQQSGAAARYLHLNANRGRLALATSGQTHGHSASAGAFSVAAVDVATAFGGPFVGGPANPVEPFSSDGPRQIFYDRDGRPITPGNLLAGGGFVRQKPDLAAADGVSTATPGFLPFFGTSAAAPHAAAIGALALSLVPTLTEEQIRQLYRGVALDTEAVGVDRDSGIGIVNAVPALQALAGLIQVAVDIRPQQCPNRVRVDTWGNLSVAIAGTDSLDVRDISPSSIRLAGVAPTGASFSDVVTPFEPFVDKGDARDCTREGADGIEDLLLRFGDRALGAASERKVVVVPLTGELEDGTPIHGEDVLVGVAPRGSAGPSQDAELLYKSAVDPAVISDLLDRE